MAGMDQQKRFIVLTTAEPYSSSIIINTDHIVYVLPSKTSGGSQVTLTGCGFQVQESFETIQRALPILKRPLTPAEQLEAVAKANGA